ncbi:MAG: radical SAM protein [Pirellulaceae bacterium]
MQRLPKLTQAEIVGLRPYVKRPIAGVVPLDVLVEREAADCAGAIADVLTVLLRGSECAFRCVMCDLWKHTHQQATPAGALPAQIAAALAAHGNQRQWIKLYNASNFFAPSNVPREDLPRIAEQVQAFDRVIVENHPRLLSDSIIEFRQALGGRLEIGMGLETVCPTTLAALNKQMTLDDFCAACQWLHERDVDLRTFVLLRPPGMDESEGIEWCIRSVEYAHALGVRHISIVPLRAGNGAIEHLQSQGLFTPPLASSLEATLRAVVELPGAIVTADLWDWHRLRGLEEAGGAEFKRRIEAMNLTQHLS